MVSELIVNDDEYDTHDEEFSQEVIWDKTKKDSFLSLIASASECVDLILETYHTPLSHRDWVTICTPHYKWDMQDHTFICLWRLSPHRMGYLTPVLGTP